MYLSSDRVLNTGVIVAPANLPQQLKLTTGTKNLITSISMDIIKSWPPFSGDSAADSRNTLVLVNAHAFVTHLFNPKLQLVVNKDVGEKKKASKWLSCCILGYI
jgi:hypothetical protein